MTKEVETVSHSAIPIIGSLLATSTLAFLLSACSGGAKPTPVSLPATPTAVAQATASEVRILADVLGGTPSVRAIAIDNNGMGYFSESTIHYSLGRGTDGYSGTAYFSFRILSPSKTSRTSSTTVTIPLDVAETFLKQLATSPLEEGLYDPETEPTDNYPSLSIDLQLDQHSVRVYSQSQAEDRVPWAVDISGKTYIINSAQPAQAFAMLAPYLKEDILDQLTTAAGDEMQHQPYQPTATP